MPLTSLLPCRAIEMATTAPRKSTAFTWRVRLNERRCYIQYIRKYKHAIYPYCATPCTTRTVRVLRIYTGIEYTVRTVRLLNCHRGARGGGKKVTCVDHTLLNATHFLPKEDARKAALCKAATTPGREPHPIPYPAGALALSSAQHARDPNILCTGQCRGRRV